MHFLTQPSKVLELNLQPSDGDYILHDVYSGPSHTHQQQRRLTKENKIVFIFTGPRELSLDYSYILILARPFVLRAASEVSIPVTQ